MKHNPGALVRLGATFGHVLQPVFVLQTLIAIGIPATARILPVLVPASHHLVKDLRVHILVQPQMPINS